MILESSIKSPLLNLSNDESDLSFSKAIKSLVVPVSFKDLSALATETIQSRELSREVSIDNEPELRHKKHKKSRTKSLEAYSRSSRHKEKKKKRSRSKHDQERKERSRSNDDQEKKKRSRSKNDLERKRRSQSKDDHVRKKRSRSKDDQDIKVKRSNSHRYSSNYKRDNRSHSKYDDLSDKELKKNSYLKFESQARKTQNRDEKSISNESCKNYNKYDRESKSKELEVETSRQERSRSHSQKNSDALSAEVSKGKIKCFFYKFIRIREEIK